MPRLSGALARACLPLALGAPASAEPPSPTIVVTAERHAQAEAHAVPATRASVDAAAIATTVNALTAEDALKYLPGLLVRKRNPGDTQAPLATRTGGVGASARSLIYADGALLSALIGNNNTVASPRWSILAPQEIARVDVLYGPFSAAYPGNAIGAVVNITTRMPDRLEGTVTAGTTVQQFDRYGTRGTFPAYQLGGTLGGRTGGLSLFASADHLDSRAQPLLFVTAAQPPATGGAGAVTVGGVSALDRTGRSIRVLGASGIEHAVQDKLKLKAALDLGGATLAYTGAMFLNDIDATAETYLTGRANGQPIYAGALAIDGRAYAVPASAFSGGTYRTGQRHWSHALTLTGPGERLDWRVVATAYDFAHDVQRSPTTALPGARRGGAGTITRLDGTGWQTLDAEAGWSPVPAHRLRGGGHLDRFTLASNRYQTADWLNGGESLRDLRSRGRTRTAAMWLQDAWALTPRLTLTLGGRQEWWRAYDGENVALASGLAVRQPVRAAARFSPKAALAFAVDGRLTLRASYGSAWRFPTVAELYQIVTTPVPAVPNPDLKPEHADSAEIAAEWRTARGGLRLSLFGERVRDALISQAGPLPGTATLATFVQNVGRTRARGAELAFDRTDLLARIDLSGNVTYVDAETRANAALPTSIGKRLPQVPAWKATLVGTWRPVEGLALTAAARYASRLWGTLDHTDVVGGTYQGFQGYLVVDLRAAAKAGEHLSIGLGVDNLNNRRYFLFHPFPQRSFQMDATVKL